MGKIRWTEKSSTHLMAIHDYIAKDSKTYATRFIKSLIKASSKLEIIPRCGRIMPEFEIYGFREVIYKSYRIIYRIIDYDNVEILAVVHGAREIKPIFQEEWEL